MQNLGHVSDEVLEAWSSPQPMTRLRCLEAQETKGYIYRLVPISNAAHHQS